MTSDAAAKPRKSFWLTAKPARTWLTTAFGFVFVVVGTTGLIFQFLFKTKPLENIHAWLGVTMVALAVIHVVQNWKPLSQYLRNVWVWALLAPLIIASFVLAATASTPKGRGINPRMLVGRLSSAQVSDLARVFGREPDDVVTAMKNDSIPVSDGAETLNSVAQKSHRPAEALLRYFMD